MSGLCALKQQLREIGATAADPICVPTPAPRPVEPALLEAMGDSPPALIPVGTLFRALGGTDADAYGGWPPLCCPSTGSPERPARMCSWSITRARAWGRAVMISTP